MSRIGKQAHPRARRRDRRRSSPSSCASTARAASSPSASSATSTVAQEGEELLVTRPTDRGEHRALHGLTRSLVANMVEGVTSGFTKTLEIQGVGYRAALKGQRPRARARLLAPGPDQGARRHRVRGAAAHARRSSRASPSSWSARSPRTSASSARRSPTRARASATRASTSPGRSASAHERQDQAQPGASSAAAASARRSPAPPSGRASPCSAPTAASPRSSSTTSPAARWPPVSWTEATCAALAKMEQATQAGKLLAERAKAAGVETAVFDRGGYQYHGRVKALRRGRPRGRAGRLACSRPGTLWQHRPIR